MIGAGVALAVTEIPSAFAGGPSLVVAVGSRFIDRTAGSLRGPAVALFGTNDKPALVVGVIVISLAVGAWLGHAAGRRFRVAVAGFAAFAAVGLVASAADPQANMAAAVIAALLGASAGVATLGALLLAAPSLGTVAAAVADDTASSVAPLRNPAEHGGSRRQFFYWAGGASAAALGTTFVSRVARSSTSVASAREAVTLPAPKSRIPIPDSQTLVAPGLSPYVTPNADFYRIDTALLVPQVRVAGWKLSIAGKVSNPFSLTYDELLAMDMVEEPVTLQCVSNEIGGPLVGNAVWQGVPLKALLDRAGVQAGGEQIVGRSVDGFTAGFPTAVGLDGRTALVAVAMNGEPLPVVHGFPARLVVAGLYGYVSATKWLKSIELTGMDFDGYWIPRGWSKEAPIKTMARIDTPISYRFVDAGRIPIAGVAWAPTRGIAKVEVQIDNGEWLPARLGTVASSNTWVQWLVEWNATKGSHTVRVRATDGGGETQTAETSAPDPDGATGYHTITVNVR